MSTRTAIVGNYKLVIEKMYILHNSGRDFRKDMRIVLKVLDIALAQVGYLEKESKDNLDNKSGNAGRGNWTKYARDLDAIPGFYNGKKNGYAWCAVFVDWCFVQAYGVDKTREMTCHTKLGAGCDYAAGSYKAASRWHVTPRVGDEVFFRSGSASYAHTGLVVSVNGDIITTVEGNTSGASGVISNGGGVCKKTYKVGSSAIVGYGRPDYSLVDDTLETIEEVCDVEIKVLRKGNKGSAVKALQLLLYGNHYSCGVAGADGDFGNETLAAVKAYQKDKGLSTDGVVGAKTWAALLR